jgi:hypothetical protein
VTAHSSSIESRARQLAGLLNRDELLDYAINCRKKKMAAARVFFRAVEIWDEDRALERSMKLCNTLGPAVYQMRPHGPLPSDGAESKR